MPVFCSYRQSRAKNAKTDLKLRTRLVETYSTSCLEIEILNKDCLDKYNQIFLTKRSILPPLMSIDTVLQVCHG